MNRTEIASAIGEQKHRLSQVKSALKLMEEQEAAGFDAVHFENVAIMAGNLLDDIYNRFDELESTISRDTDREVQS